MRIGVPILITVLLIVTAVSLTLAATAGNDKAVVSAYSGVKPGTVQYSADTRCENCPNYEGCPNVGKCSGTCADGSRSNCSGTCVGAASAEQVQPTCRGSSYGSSGSLRGSCGGCRTY